MNFIIGRLALRKLILFSCFFDWVSLCQIPSKQKWYCCIFMSFYTCTDWLFWSWAFFLVFSVQFQYFANVWPFYCCESFAVKRAAAAALLLESFYCRFAKSEWKENTVNFRHFSIEFTFLKILFRRSSLLASLHPLCLLRYFFLISFFYLVWHHFFRVYIANFFCSVCLWIYFNTFLISVMFMFACSKSRLLPFKHPSCLLKHIFPFKENGY